MKTFKQYIAEGSSNLPPGHRQIVVNTHHTQHGKIVVVHHGANFTAVLHPQHIEAIKKLPVGGAHHFKDEQGHKWRAVRGDNYIHLKDQDGKGNYETHVPAHHIMEEVVTEVSKKLLARYIGKAAFDLGVAGHSAGETPNTSKSNFAERGKYYKRMGKRHTGINKAAEKLAKEETVVEDYRQAAQQGIGFERSTIHRIHAANQKDKARGFAVSTMDYYHPHTGDKREGHLYHVGNDHYTIKDHKTGEKHFFKYLSPREIN